MAEQPQSRYVQMPDNTYVEWPEGVSAADFKSKMAGKYGNAPMAQHELQPASPIDTSASSWLHDLESDLRGGGGKTFIGRGMGALQGRGDKGMSGLESGVGSGVANEIGSLPLGLTKMAEGVAEHNPLEAIGGGFQAASIPLQFAAGPAFEEIRGAIPSLERAGGKLNAIREAMGNSSVPLTSRTLEPLERAQQLSSAGHGTVGALDSLYNRINTVNPLEFGEARDRASALSRLTGEDLIKGSPSLVRQSKMVSHGLTADTGNAAAQMGLGQEFADAMKEYSQASGLRDLVGNVKKYGVPAALGGLGAAGVAKLMKLKDLIAP